MPEGTFHLKYFAGMAMMASSKVRTNSSGAFAVSIVAQALSQKTGRKQIDS